FLARTLFIAAGVGAFQPKLPAMEGMAHYLEQYLGQQIHTTFDETATWAGQQVLILGDTDVALGAAITLAQSPARPQSITLMHRREVFAAEPETIATFEALVQSGALHFLAGQPSGFMDSQGILRRHLNGMRYINSNGEESGISVDALLILQGLSPKLGPIAQWGLEMERRQLTVNTETFATSVSPIFAVGDIVTYPGKKKLILCGFHECVLAAFAAATLIFPGKKVPLEYTTTSSRLHRLLGANSARPL
ncbi:MAG: NAD(P)/FAD-dependent oxidoreductase, partial [Rhodoferax sp.]|nr:NAD(P)/FAD-dependent oxidoreductase [Rhodoferax sp.]